MTSKPTHAHAQSDHIGIAKAARDRMVRGMVAPLTGHGTPARGRGGVLNAEGKVSANTAYEAMKRRMVQR